MQEMLGMEIDKMEEFGQLKLPPDVLVSFGIKINLDFLQKSVNFFTGDLKLFH
jgi:hypothetical protein